MWKLIQLMLALAAIVIVSCDAPPVSPSPTVLTNAMTSNPPVVSPTGTPTTPTTLTVPAQLPSSPGSPVPDGATLRLGIGEIRTADLSPDTRYIAVGTTTAIYVYNTATFKQVWRVPVKSPVIAALWSPNGQRIAAWLMKDSRVYVWNATTGEEGAALETGLGYLAHQFNPAWSPDSAFLAVPTYDKAPGSIVSLWDSETWNLSRLIRFESFAQYEFTLQVRVIAWSADGKMLAGVTEAKSSDGKSHTILVLADTATGKVINAQEGPRMGGCVAVTGLAFSPDSSRIAAFAGPQGGGDFVCSDNHYMIWSLLKEGPATVGRLDPLQH